MIFEIFIIIYGFFCREVNSLLNEVIEKKRPTWFADEVEKIADKRCKDLVKRMIDPD